ncbi:MAG: type I secretion system permease/ATPase [Acidovorax sp.]|jgi:ATP-binding cassette subfamily C exporter for protease/lipase|nr:type I secretion system permease/ATPase [Acidovorax sp.]
MNPQQRAGNAPPSELRAVVLAFKPHYWRAFFFALMGALLVLVPTVYMFEVYGRVVNSRSHMTLAMLTLGVVLAYVVMEVLDWARSETLREAGVLFDRRMAPRVFQAMYENNLRRLGPTSVQPMNDLRTLRDFFPHPVVGAVMESPISLVFMVILFMANPLLGWSAVAGAVVQVLLAWLNERSTNPPLVQANRAAIGAQQYIDGSLRNAEVIEAMGMLKHIHRRWMDKQRDFLNLQAQASDKGGAFQAGSKFVQTVMGSALLGLGGWLVLQNTLAGGAGMMIVASVLGGRMLAPVVLAVSQWRAVVNVRDAWRRLDGLLAAVPEPAESMSLPAPRGVLQVEQIVAAAPGSNAPILRGVAFALAPGEVLGVVGPSASGKTTLARVLIGLWPSMGGKVRLDGADVFAWNKLELGPHLGYLPQGVELLDGTLAENIARFGEVDRAKVEAAARLVGLHDFILALPQGYDSPVGPGGAILSGGQRQRVALARALYGDPVFVVLDEPNSSLDEAGDAALLQAIAQMKARGTTFVVMTHRVSVLGVADKMLVLRDGTQQAFGPRDQVLAALNQANQSAAQQAQQAQAPAAAASAASPTLVAPAA